MRFTLKYEELFYVATPLFVLYLALFWNKVSLPDPWNVGHYSPDVS